MKKFFLVTNLSECILFSREYSATHIPFVLNIHEFRYFDIRKIPYVTIGHFVGPQQTRGLFDDFMSFLRRFLNEMDTSNLSESKKIFDAEFKLFSLIAYDIYRDFFNVFRFAYCIHLMRNNNECEIQIPFTHSETKPAEICWPGVEDTSYSKAEIFKAAADYFTDTTNLKMKKVTYTPEVETTAKCKKQNIWTIIKPSLRKFRDSYRLLNYRYRYNGKCAKYILNVDDYNLWSPLLNTATICGFDERIALIPANALIEDIVIKHSDCQPDNQKIRLSRVESTQDTFLPFFRCKEFIQDLIFPLYEQILTKSVPRFKALKELFTKGRVCAVVGHACGARFISALTSQLARLHNIPVVGMQHGGHYGYMNFSDKMGYADYFFCDYWFSWGFEKKYLEYVFTSNTLPTANIIPVGSIAVYNLIRNKTKARKKKLKIIYPMLNNITLAQSGFRVDDFKLYCLQKKILEKLFSSNAEILLKPPKGFAIALDDMVKSAPKNIKVSFKPLLKIYEEYDFEWIIIDILSTPFEEACVSESQILVFNDSDIWPIEPQARALMEKRAWLYDNEQKFLGMLDKILAGEPLNKKHDKSFEQAFILPYGEDTIHRAKEELSRIISIARK